MKQLKVFLAVLLLSITTHAKAGLITTILDVEVIFGPGTGTLGTITVEYDDSLISGTGEEFLDSPDFTVTLDLFGQIFTNSDDIDFPALPALEFFDGEIVFIDYIISELFGFNLTEIDDPLIGEIFGGDVISGVWLAGTVGAEVVNEPSTILMFMMMIIALSVYRKRANTTQIRNF